MMVIVSEIVMITVLIVVKCEGVLLTMRRSSTLVVQGRVELCNLKLSFMWVSVSKKNLVAVGIASMKRTTVLETILYSHRGWGAKVIPNSWLTIWVDDFLQVVVITIGLKKEI